MPANTILASRPLWGSTASAVRHMLGVGVITVGAPDALRTTPRTATELLYGLVAAAR